MKLPRRKFLHLAAGAAVLPAVARPAWAQIYPTRPVRLVVPFGSAGGTDIVARLVGQWLSERLRPQGVGEKRAGAGGELCLQTGAPPPPRGDNPGPLRGPRADNPAPY